MIARQRSKQGRKQKKGSSETAAADTATIFWMLTVFTTLLCELGWAGARLYVAWVDSAAERMQLLGALLLLAAVVIGISALIMTPIVLRARRVPPPRGIVVFALLTAALPLLLVVVQMM